MVCREIGVDGALACVDGSASSGIAVVESVDEYLRGARIAHALDEGRLGDAGARFDPDRT